MSGEHPPQQYREAFERSRNRFGADEPLEMARRAGGEFEPERSVIVLCSLGRRLQVSYPEGEVRFRDSSEQPMWQWRLVTLNYLSRADGKPPSGKLVAFRQLNGGRAYQHAFVNRTVGRLGELIDEHPAGLLQKALQSMGGSPVDLGDVGAVVRFMPRFPITVAMWRGDCELSSSASISFDSTANRYLHTEDAAVAAAITVEMLDRQVGSEF